VGPAGTGAGGMSGEAGVGELGERFPEVLAAAAAGDPGAFAELWRATHPVLLRYLKVICGDQGEDVASETWLKAIRALPSFVGDEQAFRGWLTVVARNHVRDLGRQAARRPEVLTPEPPPRRGNAPDAADEALERLGTERALQLLASLPAAQAEIVALRVIVGLEPAEVGRIVGRSAGAVRVAVHRALGTLAETLTGTPVTAVSQ
jgi:RNA polymerase sigma-70 factor (ECF subfamily)